MDVSHGMALLFTHCSIAKSYYNWETRIWRVDVFSFQHASNSILSIQPVQVTQYVSYRKVGVYGSGYVTLSSQMTVRRSLQSPSRDDPRSMAAETDRLHLRRHSANISNMVRQKLYIYSNANQMFMSGTPAFARKPSWSRKEDYGDSYTLSPALFAPLLACLTVKTVWNGCRPAGCSRHEGTQFLNYFIPSEVRGRSHCKFRTLSIMARRLSQSVRTVIQCLAAVLSFASGISGQYAMRIGKQDNVWSVLWSAWKVLIR